MMIWQKDRLNTENTALCNNATMKGEVVEDYREEGKTGYKKNGMPAKEFLCVMLA